MKHSRWGEPINGQADAYFVQQGTGKRFGPYTTIVIAGEIRDVLARCYPESSFRLTSEKDT